MDTSVVDTTLHYSGLHRQFYYNACFYVYLIDLINVGNLLQLFKEKCKGLIHFLDRNVLNNCFFKSVNCLIYEEHAVNFG